MTEEPGRYRVSLTVGGVRVANGWWNLLATAEKKWTGWVGEQGRDGARIELVDTETSDVLKAWP
ncbi:hypothetical protein [Streptomyces sp. cg35]|uniref:hypothetical protein n=1 Tax=Streptomyces sp. cg35 TaxID=3421650 RepID=UPI003D16E788